MNKLTPISHRELINKLHKLGFEGPYPGGRHPYSVYMVLYIIVTV